MATLIFISLLIFLAGCALCYMAYTYIKTEPAKTFIIIAFLLLTAFVLLRFHHIL